MIDSDLQDQIFDLVDEYFPKHQCKERGQAMVLAARILLLLQDGHPPKGQGKPSEGLKEFGGIIES